MFTFFGGRCIYPPFFLEVKNVPCPFLEVKNKPFPFLEVDSKPCPFSTIGRGESLIPAENCEMLFEKMR